MLFEARMIVNDARKERLSGQMHSRLLYNYIFPINEYRDF